MSTHHGQRQASIPVPHKDKELSQDFPLQEFICWCGYIQDYTPIQLAILKWLDFTAAHNMQQAK
jgi:hypothetical protein